MPEEIKDQFVEWLDPHVIADGVRDIIEEVEETPTLERMKEVYLRFLEDLWDNLKVCV